MSRSKENKKPTLEHTTKTTVDSQVASRFCASFGGNKYSYLSVVDKEPLRIENMSDEIVLIISSGTGEEN